MIMSSIFTMTFFLGGCECDFSPLTLLTGEPNVTITANLRYRGSTVVAGRRYWHIAWCDKDKKCRSILIGKDKE